MTGAAALELIGPEIARRTAPRAADREPAPAAPGLVLTA
jgi:hypothetical protein